MQKLWAAIFNGNYNLFKSIFEVSKLSFYIAESKIYFTFCGTVANGLSTSVKILKCWDWEEGPKEVFYYVLIANQSNIVWDGFMIIFFIIN